MISVTEGARQELKKVLSANTDNPEAGLRLATSGSGQLGLSIKTESPGDQVVEHEGSKVLLVAGGLATELEGVTLDVQDTPEGSKLTIVRAS